MRVSELLPEERPREKLLAKGPSALTDVELLAVLLRTGKSGQSVLQLARSWLSEVGGLESLAALEPERVLERPGIGPAKASVIAAALELGRRLARLRLSGTPILDRPEEVAGFLTRHYARERVEIFGCLTIDARNRLLRVHELHRGARTSSQVEPAEIFHRAVMDNANGVILFHTHPSGDPTPSEDDIALTRDLREVGRRLRVRVLDHLVVARAGFVSLRQRGVIGSD